MIDPAVLWVAGALAAALGLGLGVCGVRLNPSRRKLRGAVLASLLILLGLTTTVAVAWFFAGMAHPALARNRVSSWTGYASFDGNGWHGTQWTGTGKRSRLLRLSIEPPWTDVPTFDPPKWSAALTAPEPGTTKIIEDERGWPWLSLRCAWRDLEPFTLPNEPVDNGLVVHAFAPDWLIERSMVRGDPDFNYIEMDAHRALPLSPIWPGLLGSTLFFAVFWAATAWLFGLPAGVRHWLRHRGGRCIRCAYSLRGIQSAACPECGWEIAHRQPFISKFQIVGLAAMALVLVSACAAWAGWLAREYQGPGPLHLAAGMNDLPRLRELIARGADVNQSMPQAEWRYHEEQESTPLMWAAARGKIEAARLLLDAGANPIVTGCCGQTALGYAAKYNHPGIVELLLARRTRNGDTAAGDDPGILEAAGGANPEPLRLIIASGASVNVIRADEWSDSPLSAAARAGRIENMRLLIQAGADLNAPADHPPLHAAIEAGQSEAALLLLELGAKIDEAAGPILWEAAEHNLTDVAAALLARGADPNHAHSVAKGWTPLRRAVIRSNLRLAKMLVQAGADPLMTDQNGESILFCFEWDAAPSELFDYLLTLGINIDARSDGGCTVLMQQVYWQRPAAVRRLLEAGADPTARDHAGHTALDYAEQSLPLNSGGVSFTQGRPVNPEILQLLRQGSAAR